MYLTDTQLYCYMGTWDNVIDLCKSQYSKFGKKFNEKWLAHDQRLK